MNLIVLCMVFVPFVLLMVSVSVRAKNMYFITTVSAVLFLMCVLLSFTASSMSGISVPPIIWRIISFITVFFIFLRSIRDRQLLISVFTFIQAMLLVIFDTTVLPAVPENFLYPNLREKLLLLTGTLAILTFLPFVIYSLKKYYGGSGGHVRFFCTGFGFLLSSFAGLISSTDMCGLFLFWQWQYLSGYMFHRMFGTGKRDNIFVKTVISIQQAALTFFLTAEIIAYKLTGSSAMQDFSHGFGKISELVALIIFACAVLMGWLIPENYTAVFNPVKAAVPVTGMYLIVFSLIVPYGVLLKFRPLFHGLPGSMISLMIIYGGILVFAGSYYALLGYRNRRSILNMIMSISGLAVATVFKNLQPGVRFISDNPLPLLLVIAGIVLTVAYIIMWISSIFTHTGQTSECDDRFVASIIPFNINFGLLIKISYVTTAALILGVSLECLR